MRTIIRTCSSGEVCHRGGHTSTLGLVGHAVDQPNENDAVLGTQQRAWEGVGVLHKGRVAVGTLLYGGGQSRIHAPQSHVQECCSGVHAKR